MARKKSGKKATLLTPAQVDRLICQRQQLAEGGNTPEWSQFHHFLNQPAVLTTHVGLLKDPRLWAFWWTQFMGNRKPELRYSTSDDRLAVDGFKFVFDEQMTLGTALFMAEALAGEAYQLNIRCALIASTFVTRIQDPAP